MTRQQILRLAQNKMISGAKKHGRWNPNTDNRDLVDEEIQEQLDTINYAIMQIQKLARFRKQKK